MITLKRIFEKLNQADQLNQNLEMTEKDYIQSNLECEKAKALGQNNYHSLIQ